MAVSRFWCALILALVGALLVAVGASGLSFYWVLLFALLLLATAISPGEADAGESGSIVSAVPNALLVLLAIPFISVPLGFVGIELWGTRASALISWFVVLLVLVVVAWQRGGRVRVLSGAQPAAIGFLAMTVVGFLVTTILPVEVWTRNVSRGTDFSRHLVLVKEAAGDGELLYTTNTYPHLFQSLFGWLWQATGEPSYLQTWVAMEATLWFLLGVILVALLIVAQRVGRWLSMPRWASDWVAPTVVAVVFVQSVWVTTMFQQGFVSSIVAGAVFVCIAAVMLRPGAVHEVSTVVWLSIALAVQFHTWSLLAPPIFVLLAFVWIYTTKRHGITWATVLAPVIAGLLCLWLLLNLVRHHGSPVDSLETPAVTALDWPGLAWIVALIPVVLVLVLLWQLRYRSWPASIVLLFGATVGILAAIAVVTGQIGWTPTYYVAKTVWTATLLLLPVAVIGSVWLLWQVFAWAGRQKSPWRVPAFAVVAALIVLGGAAIAGQLAGSPSRVYAGVTSGMGPVPFQLVVAEGVEGKVGDWQANDGVLVMGLAPYGQASSIAYLRTLDWLGAETLGWWAPDQFLQGRVRWDRTITAEQACESLRAHPDSLRITGPNPETAIPWLEAAGCPADVIRADQWIHVPIDDRWFEGLGMQGRPYEYPTPAEVDEYLADRTPDA